MLAVVLSFDRFPLSLLGCYGNSTVQTPCLDHIAAAGLVFDQHFGENFSPHPNGHAWWSGCHHFPRPGSDWLSRMPSLPDLLAAGDVQSQWITEADDSPLLPLPENAPLIREATLGDVIQRGGEVLEAWSHSPKSRQLLWLKIGGSAWDFSQLPDMDWSEGEAALLPGVLESGIEGPQQAEWSFDQWEIYRELMELTVERLDAAIASLWERVQFLGKTQRVLFLITAAQGLLLGNRAQLPTRETAFVEDCVHLPLIAYHSGHPGGERCSLFTQSTDLPATLLDYFAYPASESLEGRSFLPIFSGEIFPERETLTYGSHGAWEAVRTREFYWVRVGGDDAEEPRRLLFMKPEDVWDWHDVATQEPEMTETLSEKLDKFLEAAQNQLPLACPRAEICEENKSG